MDTNNQLRYNNRVGLPSSPEFLFADRRYDMDTTRSGHAHLSKTLQAALRILDSEAGNVDNIEKEKPFYLNHVTSLINNDMKNKKRRTLIKRSAFDSIAHQGGLGGFRGYGAVPGQQRKRPFTFQELLPYLLSEMRRKNRDMSFRN